MRSPDRVTTVLIVDDHSLVRRAFRRTLEDESDIRVVGEASDGQKAVEAAQRMRPDVVLMDFALPGMTGALATQHIRETLPGVAVLIVSMHSEPSYIRAALDMGVQGYLLKSTTDLNLVDAVRKVAAGKHVLDSRIALPWSGLGHSVRPLSPRELQVLHLIAHGKSTKQIAVALGIRATTVGVHRNNIMEALAIHNVAELTLYAIGRGLVKIP
jgi:DNA-binding NarL/FixJ family response regulator